PSPAPKLARRNRVTGQVDPATFASIMSDLVARNAHRQTRLHVFSLTDFRQAVGGKWGRLQGLVEVAADAIVCKHINLDRDIFTRIDEETSCLAMPRASHREAQVCVAAIAQDIAAHLFGDATIDGRRPRVVAADMQIDAAMDDGGSLDFLAIQHAVLTASEALLSAPHRDTLEALLPSPTRPIFAFSGDRNNRPPPADGPNWQPLPTPKHTEPLPVFTMDRSRKDASEPTPALDWAKPGGRRSGEPLPVFTISNVRKERSDPTEAPAWLETQLDEKAHAARDGARQMAPETDLKLSWIPVWVTGRQAIGAFQARVIRRDSAASPAMEGVQAYAGAAPIEALTLDRFIATQAAFELKNQFIGQHRMGLTIPFHWMSLAPRWRDCVRMPFEDCPPAARRKLLKIEIFGLSPDMPEAILHTLFEPLEKIGCDVMARLPLDAVHMIPSLRGVRAVGVDLSQLTDEDVESDDKIFADLSHFRDATRQAKAACYVWGVPRRRLIARLVRAGFSLLSGPGLAGAVSRPTLPTAGNRAA
ncbi:MAG: hypothetical protein K2X44_12880, partial [Magnetospirillum sp.]|nr:hypothetical protein [Magnetospirillum sp.]